MHHFILNRPFKKQNQTRKKKYNYSDIYTSFIPQQPTIYDAATMVIGHMSDGQ